MKLAIYGIGGMGYCFWEMAQRIDPEHERWNEILFVDDVHPGDIMCGIKIITFEEIRARYAAEEVEFAISVGEPASRKKMREKVENAGFHLATLIEPRLIPISKSTVIEEGAVIQSAASIDVNVHIGKNVFIQSFSVVAHGATVGEDSCISPFTMICGNCNVGKCVFLGAHTAVKQGVTIGDHAIISMFTPVHRNVPDNYTVFSQMEKMVSHEPDEHVF